MPNDLPEGRTPPTALDLESHLIAPGRLAPTPVIGSMAVVGGPAHLVRVDDIRARWPKVVRTSEMLVGANIAFDFGILAAHELVGLNEIFRAYAENRVYDVQLAQALDGIANGCLFKEPSTGHPLQGAGGKRARYSLDTCVRLTLGRDNAKENDFYRMRYAVLAELPVEEWPEEARQYPRDDADNTLAVALGHIGETPRMAMPTEGPWGTRVTAPLQNLGNLPLQVRAAWALHLASLWGIRTDPVRVAALREKVDADFAVAVKAGQDAGFLREDGTEMQAAVKKTVAAAYGATGSCVRCSGTGKVLGAETKSGKRNPVVCKGSDGGCDGTSYDLATAPSLPRTDLGAIRADRDTLEESGDDVLAGYGHITEIEKHRSTYLPALEAATIFPRSPRPNVLVDTGRTSYDGIDQTFPRKGGLREAHVPREGWVYSSIDYAALELCTLGQVLVDIFGSSSIADAINASRDPGILHTALAARMIGTDTEDLAARIKAGDPQAKAFRQAAKAANFGFPGGMGAATFVLAKRKGIEGETKSPDHRADADGRTLSGVIYSGLRLCILMTGAMRCGTEKVREHKGREIPPTCAACLACATDLREQWLRQWPEMKRYFDHVSTVADSGEMVQHRSGRRRAGIDFSSCANGYFQGLAADGAKHALWLVSKECYTDPRSAMFGARPVFFAHDEIFSEIPEVIAHRAAPRMAEVMVSAMREWVPDVWIAAEPALMRRWSKEAGPVYVDGRLVPDPKAG